MYRSKMYPLPFLTCRLISAKWKWWWKTFLLEINTLSLLTFSAENKAKSLRVRLLRLGGTAGGGGFIPIPWSFLFILESRDLIETPLGGRAGGPLGPTLPLEISVLEGGAGAILFPFIILCGSIGEFVANCEAVTAFVFKVPVLLDVMPRPLAGPTARCAGNAVLTAVLIWKIEKTTVFRKNNSI